MAARHGTWVVALALLLASVPSGLARQAQPSSQATPAAATSTSAILIGLVVDGETGEPIEDATVTLTGRPAPTRGRSVPPAPGSNPLDLLLTLGATDGADETVVTAGNGRFVFRGLPVSFYTVRAQATGFVDETSALRGTRFVFVEIREGQTTATVTVRLRKQAVVTGTVVDEAGDPVIAATVRAYRRSVSRLGTLSFDPAVAASTDDRGIYRLSGLTPGEYLVFVPQSSSTSAAGAGDAMMQAFLSGRMPEGGLGSISAGGASPMDPRAIRMGEWRLLSYNVQLPAAGDGPLQAYRTVYYPAAGAVSDASWISLRSGEERDGV